MEVSLASQAHQTPHVGFPQNDPVTIEIIEKINPIVEQCPYKDGSKANKLIANPEMMKREKEKRFDAPIKKALESIIKREKGSNFSPILEFIQSIKFTVLHEVTSTNKKRTSSEKKPIEFHLFSDF